MIWNLREWISLFREFSSGGSRGLQLKAPEMCV